MFKLLHNCTNFIWVKWCSKFSIPGFNSTWTENFQMYKLKLKKADTEKAREFQKNPSTSVSLTKDFDCEDHSKLWKILKGWKYQITWPASWETFMQVKKQQLELNMKQKTGSKLGKECVKVVYCHSAYLTYIQSTSWGNAGLDESQAGIKIARKISRTPWDMQMTPH